MTFNERDKFRSQQDPQRCVLAPLKGAAVFLFFLFFLGQLYILFLVKAAFYGMHCSPDGDSSE